MTLINMSDLKRKKIDSLKDQIKHLINQKQELELAMNQQDQVIENLRRQLSKRDQE